MTDLFNEKAKDWDINEMVKMLSSAIGSSIIEHLPLHDQMSVMDFGAGTGLISSHIAPLVKNIVAIDTSEAMLNKLVSKPELNGKVEIICRDITDDPIDRQFDLIMSAMTLHHVKGTGKLIQRFAEHLNPGGLIALADLDKEDGTFHPQDTEGVFHPGFERSELRSILEEHGFTEIHFLTAHTINKEEKSFPVFLVTAKKK
ncbi:MAG TPA: class I SAM-dependent methyltransferase [Nitrospirae bacterium]|nr:class I SAM-dependent methyltransferase [Nitrospirota bacterium]HEW81685.1 class I SAM-dependent methyltransferase [Nitrospirota bacterium]